MSFLTPEEYQQLRAGAKVIEADSHGEKVLRLPDGNYIKLFRRKRLLSSALFYPYAQRFVHNAVRLRQLAIPCPTVIALYKLKEPRRDLVHYQPLAGETLRQLRQHNPQPERLLEHLASFVAQLHEQGVYFRSLHLGNIVLTPEGQLGLIDIADLQVQRRPLSDAQRLRNFRHMLRDAEDKAWLRSGGDGRFVKTYQIASGRQLSLPALQ